MSPASPSLTLVSYKFAECKTLPRLGEIIPVCLSQDLFGTGSEIATQSNLPSGATRYNYHHAMVLHLVLEDTISLTILPMPSYSSTDPVSGLSSTSWLLAQPEDFQRLHIPVPYEEDPTRTHPHPPFPEPAGFGSPLEIGGWKHSRPSWIQAVPQLVEWQETTTFQRFEPRVILSNDEFWRIRDYCILHSPPVVSSGRTGTSSIPLAHQADGNGDEGPSAALRSLYANGAVKYPLPHLSRVTIPLDPESDSDSDDDWVEVDGITFARYYASSIPFLATVVEEHDKEMRELLDQRIATWAAGVP